MLISLNAIRITTKHIIEKENKIKGIQLNK